MVRQSLLKDKPIDYSQTYISSYYLELRIPPTKDNNFALPTNYLHIWPRGEFMMIALPNQDKSFTGTIFMPLELFESIKTNDDLLNFFEKHFIDVIPLIGKQDLIRQYFLRKPLPLISIKCNPHHGKKCVLIGDASHSMVPFYGQGMNCALEDCIVLFDIIDNLGFDKLDQVLSTYSMQRVPDAQAMCDLAMYNYIEVKN
jgi:kynurenine 3-monooxygenase